MNLRIAVFHCEIDPELYERLRLMADFYDTGIASLGAKLLEKAIVGEFHEFSLMADRLKRRGIMRKIAESESSQKLDETRKTKRIVVK